LPLIYKRIMEQDILKPDKTLKPTLQGFSPLGCAAAASGAAVLTFCLLGSAAAAASWAIARLFGFGDSLLYVLLFLIMLPVLAASIWMGGRAWAVEQMLARGTNIEPPVFKLFHYFAKRSA
jgi:hypothetical protein